MKVEEAIEFLDDIFSKSKNPKCNLANLNKIIYLLESIQSLEAENKAYKGMWEELKEKYEGRKTNYEYIQFISLLINELEQKYLKWVIK